MMDVYNNFGFSRTAQYVKLIYKNIYTVYV